MPRLTLCFSQQKESIMLLSHQFKISVFALPLFVGLAFFHSAIQAGDMRSAKQTPNATSTLKATVPQKSFALKNRRWSPVKNLKLNSAGVGPYTAACGSSTSISAALDQCNGQGYIFALCKKSGGNWTCNGTQ